MPIKTTPVKIAQPPQSTRFAIDRQAPAPEADDFAADVRAGLTAEQKRLAPKYFYDTLGSHLFEAICQLPEYYLTRAETEILTLRADEIAALFAEPVSLFELGSGSSAKSRHLISAFIRRQRSLHYQPVDISESIIRTSAAALLEEFDGLRLTATLGDYTRQMPRPARSDGERICALFLGSNIGNYDRAEGRDLLRSLRRVLAAGDTLLLGADLKKDRETLEAAYDDALGVTASFNLNLLLRINRELGGRFDLRRFKHRAIYSEEQGRMEIYVESRCAQEVRIEALDLSVRFAEGEMIHTENSYKYDRSELDALASETGFAPLATWLDSGSRFSCNLWRAE